MTVDLKLPGAEADVQPRGILWAEAWIGLKLETNLQLDVQLLAGDLKFLSVAAPHSFFCLCQNTGEFIVGLIMMIVSVRNPVD